MLNYEAKVNVFREELHNLIPVLLLILSEDLRESADELRAGVIQLVMAFRVRELSAGKGQSQLGLDELRKPLEV
jgi:hypothetical protein